FGDLRIRDAGSACGGGCGGRVLPVVHAADERLGWERVVGGELDPPEAETSRDDPGAGALEDAELRVAVRLEGAVAVEMVRLEVGAADVHPATLERRRGRPPGAREPEHEHLPWQLVHSSLTVSDTRTRPLLIPNGEVIARTLRPP